MKALIIEDEKLAASRLQKYIQEVDPTISVLQVLESIEETLLWFAENNSPDLVFLDIHLADGSCFEIFDRFQFDCPIIFATAYDEYALQAFEQHAIDYILKPIKKAHIERALSRARKYFNSTSTDTETKIVDHLAGKNDLKRLLVRVGPKINLVKVEDIAYLYSKDKITFAVTTSNRRYPMDKSLGYFDNHLDNDFFRINRKFIVQREAIDDMTRHTKSRVKLSLKPPIDIEAIVSTDRSRSFKKWLLDGT
ncbi:MAG: response regulator [Saprospiraceae bacterium]|nr:response regulator [Saprospiraceae bacterium]